MKKNRFSRQIKVNQVGELGQQKIHEKNILVVGAGGLGSYVASELVRTGVKALTLVDPDIVELSNLQRQAVFDENDVAQKIHKVDALSHKLSKINSETKISAFRLYLKDFLAETNQKFDLIMDCTDNFSARLLIDEYAKKKNLPFIFGSCGGTSGAFMFLHPNQTLSLEDVFKKSQSMQKKDAQTIGIITPIVPLVASYQVALALEYFVKGYTSPSFYQLEAWPPELHQFSIKKEMK